VEAAAPNESRPNESKWYTLFGFEDGSLKLESSADERAAVASAGSAQLVHDNKNLRAATAVLLRNGLKSAHFAYVATWSKGEKTQIAGEKSPSMPSHRLYQMIAERMKEARTPELIDWIVTLCRRGSRMATR